MRRHRHHAAENISIRACDESGELFLFTSPLGEYHIGATGIGFPVVGCDSELIEKLNSMLGNRFKPGTVIQFALFASPDVDHLIDVYEAGKMEGSDILTQLCHEHAELYRRAKNEPLVRASGVLANHKRLFFGIKVPVSSIQPDTETMKDVRTVIDSAFDALMAAQIHVKRMDETGYRRFVHAIHDPWAVESESVPVWDETRPLNDQILPVGMDIDYNYNKAKNTICFNSGEYFAKILSVNFLPHKAYPWVMNDIVGDWTGLTNQITDPFFLSVVLTYPDQEQTKAKVLLRSAQINNQAGAAVVRLMPEVGERKRGIDAMVNEMKRSSTTVNMTWSMTVYSRDERRLERLTNLLVAYYSTLGEGDKKFDIRVDRRILRPMFEQTLPLNATEGGLKGTFRIKTVGARHAVALLPIYGDLRGVPQSKGSLYVTRRGEPATIDPFDSDTGYNGLVFAETGAGKTMQIQGMMLDQLASGARVWAIDDGRSLEKTCNILGGQFISFGQHSDICLNPFTTIKPGELYEELDLLKTLFTKMAAPNDGLGDDKLPKLERAIIQTYESYGSSASVMHVADFLLQQEDPDAKQIGEQLFPFARGQFSQWFNGEANVNFNSSLVVLEMGELKQVKHLKDVVALQLFALITRGMRKVEGGRRKMLIIEEAKQWLLDKIMSQGIEEAFARARKDNGSAVAVTQSLLDIAESPSGQSILQNAAWMLILAQKSTSIKAAIKKDFLDLDPYAQKLLGSVSTVPGQYAEFMFKRGKQYGVYRAVYPRFTQVMLSTKGAERTAIMEAMEQGMPALEAINQFLRREREASANEAPYQLRA